MNLNITSKKKYQLTTKKAMRLKLSKAMKLIVQDKALYKTLKGTCVVQLDNLKVLCAPGPRTKYFECFFCSSINYNYMI